MKTWIHIKILLINLTSWICKSDDRIFYILIKNQDRKFSPIFGWWIYDFVVGERKFGPFLKLTELLMLRDEIIMLLNPKIFYNNACRQISLFATTFSIYIWALFDKITWVFHVLKTTISTKIMQVWHSRDRNLIGCLHDILFLLIILST
jgi:hypothetical protein